ncbi:MAG: FAD-dependent oxidoreductase [Phycisphaeraceae bacterium]|nr:FAD-dependent oxidoreductase [Phycisphaeraceae bacterium]
MRADQVCTDPAALDSASRSTSATPCSPLAVLYPATTEEVQAVVRIAARFAVPLHPVSTGKNWGYGDACPPGSGQVLVDLKRMERIREVNRELGYVVIEPGVTQGALYDYLRREAPDLWMDCTGAGLSAGVVGNALDRGFGHTRCGDHMAGSCGMEIVLGDGRLLRTGFGQYPDARADRVYPYGTGPMLDGLFSQSNFGIVTALGVWVMRRPEAFSGFFFSALDEADVGELIERLRPLRMMGLLQSAIHIANDVRTFSARTRYPWARANGLTPLPAEIRASMRAEHGIGAWNGCGGIYGTPRTVRATRREVKRALKGFRLHFVDDRRLKLARKVARVLGVLGINRRLGPMLDILEPVYGLLKGIPSDEPLAGTGWRVRTDAPPQALDPLDSHAGFMWASPVIPSTRAAAADLLNLIEPIYARHGFEPLITFTMINERAMIAVTNLSFDQRQVEEAQHATACYHELIQSLIRHGFIPYRSGLTGYGALREAGSPVFWSIADQIKTIMDPRHIFSPGRYGLGGEGD